MDNIYMDNNISSGITHYRKVRQSICHRSGSDPTLDNQETNKQSPETLSAIRRGTQSRIHPEDGKMSELVILQSASEPVMQSVG